MAFPQELVRDVSGSSHCGVLQTTAAFSLLLPLAHTLTPTPLHCQIKVLHEALACIFFNGYAERLTEGQTAFLPIQQTHLMGVQ
jgi:hypothetical protein